MSAGPSRAPLKLKLYSETNPFVVDVAPAVQLVLIDGGMGSLTATMYLGLWPMGTQLSCHTFVSARITDARKPKLVLGTVHYDLPWHALNKVADALRLDFVLLPPGGVPVAEGEAA